MGRAHTRQAVRTRATARSRSARTRVTGIRLTCARAAALAGSPGERLTGGLAVHVGDPGLGHLVAAGLVHAGLLVLFLPPDLFGGKTSVAPGP
jgi:hypothetical protein